MIYTKQVQDALAAGYSLEQIKELATSEYNDAIAQGYDRKDVRGVLQEAYGLQSGTTQQDLDDSQYLAALAFSNVEGVTTQNGEKANAGATRAQNLGEAFAAGWENSVAGLLISGKKPKYAIDENSDFTHKLASTLAMGVGDLPSLVLGGISGSVAGATAGPVGSVVGAGAGAMGFTEYTRSALMQAYTRGSAQSWGEFVDQTANNFLAGGKGAVIGAITGGAGKVIAPLAERATAKVFLPAVAPTVAKAITIGGEASVLATAMSTMEGKMPSAEDFALAGVTLGGFKMAGVYTNKAASLFTEKFMDHFQKTGEAPTETVQRSLIDPQVKERMLAVNQRITSAEEMKFWRVQVPLRPKDLEARGLETSEGRAKKFTDEEIAALGEDYPINPKEYTGEWLYLSRARAEKVVRQRAEVAKAAETDLAQVFGKETIRPGYATGRALTEEVWLPKRAPYIRLTGNTDSTIAKVMREYMNTSRGRDELQQLDPEFFKQNPDWWKGAETIGEERLIPTARAMFESPTKDFQQFLRTHNWSPELTKKLSGGVISPDGPHRVNWSGIMRSDTEGTRFFIFNEKVLKPSSKRVTGETPFDKATAKMDEVLSVGERTRKTPGDVLRSVLYHMDDVFRPINVGADRGKYTVPYLEASLTHGTAGRASHMFKYGMIDWKGDVVGKSLESILMDVTKNGGSMREFSDYLTAKSFRELNDRGINTPLDPDVTVSILKGPRAEVYEPIAKEFKKFSDQLLQYQYEAGLISKKKLDNLYRDYKVSVPLRRLIEAYEPELQAEATRAYSSLFKSDKDIGSKDTKLYVDPIESTIRSMYMVTRLAAQNATRQSVADTYGIKITDARAKNPAMTTITYMRNGKSARAAVPTAIREATSNMDAGTLQSYNAVMRGLAKVAGVFRLGTTGHFAFAIKAATIDQMEAWIKTPKDVRFTPMVDMFKGLSEIIKTKPGVKDSAYLEWMKDGGDNASIWALSRDKAQEMIADAQKMPLMNALKDPVKYHKDLRTALSPFTMLKAGFRGMENFTTMMDSATRVGVYMKAREAGYSGKESALISRRATIDFARAGATIRAVNSIIAFFNARIQGLSLTGHYLRADPLHFMSQVTTGLILPSFFLAMVQNDFMVRNQNPEDEHYDIAESLRQRPDYVKAGYWAIPVPGLDSIIKIPKPPDLALVACTPIESLVNMLYKEGGAGATTYLEQLQEDGFISGISDTLLPNVLPTAMVPITEVMTNYSFFTGNNVIPAYMENVVPAAQYKPGTSSTAKWVSEQLFKLAPDAGSNAITRLASPIGIDHIIRGWTGAVGQTLVSVLDKALDASGVYEGPVKMATRIEDLPFFNTFMFKYPSANANDISKFNKEANEMQARYNTIMSAARTGDPNAIRLAQTIASSSAFTNMQPMRSALSQMGKAVQMINLHNNDPESKREQIESIYIQMIQVSKSGRAMMKQLNDNIKEMNNAGR